MHIYTYIYIDTYIYIYVYIYIYMHIHIYIHNIYVYTQKTYRYMNIYMIYINIHIYIYTYIYIYQFTPTYIQTSLALTNAWSFPHSGPGSHDQRVADLKAFLVPSPSSIDPWMGSKSGFPRASTSEHRSFQVYIAIPILSQVTLGEHVHLFYC